MTECGIPEEIAMLVDRSNRREKGLSFLGILPNQFRKILEGSTVNPDAAWNDISKTLLPHGTISADSLLVWLSCLEKT